MDFLVPFLIGVVITAISLIILSKIPFMGIEVDSIGKALLAGVAFGVLNWLLGWLGGFKILNILTLGLFWLVVNTIIFGLAAWLIEGFRLRFGIMSAILGAIALTFVNSIMFNVFSTVLRLIPGI